MRALRSMKLLVFAAAVAAAALTAVLLLAGGSAPPAPHAQAAHPAGGHGHDDAAHQKPTFRRTLAVYTEAEPAPSAHPEQMRALLIAGKLPAGPVAATVLTDEDCEPDAQGVSHCRNRLELPNGRRLTVRHPHRMHDVPCMTPGETVRIGRAVDA